MIPQIVGGALLLLGAAARLGVSAPDKEHFSENAKENGNAQAVADEFRRVKEEAEKGIQKEYDRIQKEQAKSNK